MRCNSLLNIFKFAECNINFMFLEMSVPGSSDLIQFGRTTLSMQGSCVLGSPSTILLGILFASLYGQGPGFPNLTSSFLHLLLSMEDIYPSLLAEKMWMGSELQRTFIYKNITLLPLNLLVLLGNRILGKNIICPQSFEGIVFIALC